MANIKAQAAGNWSSTSTWSGGVIPGIGDTAYSNNKAVTIDTNITCTAISNAVNSGIGAVVGGNFTPVNGITITADVISGHNSGTNSCVLFTLAGGASATIVGTIYASAYTNSRAIKTTGTGTLNIVGDIRRTGSGVLERVY